MKKLFITLLLVCATVCAKAQQDDIIYTVFSPNLVFAFTNTTHYHNLDVDRDGLDDIDFHYYLVNYVFLEYRMEIDALSDEWEACAVNENTILDSDTLAWRSCANWVPRYHTAFAVRRMVDGNYYYGWIQAIGKVIGTDDVDATVTIPHMAFCTVPNYPLHYGQTELNVSVGENGEYGFAICPNPAKGCVTVSGTQIAEVRLHNVAGQLVATQAGNGTESLTIDISSLPSGLYFVTVTGQDGKMSVQKVVKE